MTTNINTCLYCNQSYYSKSNLIRHIKSCDKNTDNICAYCNITYNSKHTFDKHISGCIINYLPPNPITSDNTCSHCNKQYSSKHTLLRHITTCKLNNGNIFFCNHCNKKCITKCKLDKHITKCKKKITSDDTTIPKTAFNNLINNNVDGLIDIATTILNICETQHDDKTKKVSDIIEIIKTKPTSNIVVSNSTNSNNTTNNNTTNNNSNNNSNNSNSNSNVNNTNIINLGKTYINPFGYEDMSFMSKGDIIQILKTNKVQYGIANAMYNNKKNRNFTKPNYNNKFIKIYNNKLDYDIEEEDTFYKTTFIENINNTIKHLLAAYIKDIHIKDHLRIIDDMNNVEPNINEYNSLFEHIFRDTKNKKLIDNLINNIDNDPSYKQLILDYIENIEQNQIDFKKTNNIDKDMLYNKFWHNFNTIYSIDNDENNLENNFIQNTPRYQFYKKQIKAEQQFINDYPNLNIGDILDYSSYNAIRKSKELRLITDTFSLEPNVIDEIKLFL